MSELPVSYVNDEEKQKQIDRGLTDRRDIWARWRARKGSYTHEWITGATERMLDIMEKWPLAAWDPVGETNDGPKVRLRGLLAISLNVSGAVYSNDTGFL